MPRSKGTRTLSGNGNNGSGMTRGKLMGWTPLKVAKQCPPDCQFLNGTEHCRGNYTTVDMSGGSMPGTKHPIMREADGVLVCLAGELLVPVNSKAAARA